MQQRVGLARAIAANPSILLMDEPFSALDPLIRHQLQGTFMELSAELHKTTCSSRMIWTRRSASATASPS